MSAELNRFFGEVEKRAFRIARFAVRHDADALDLVQDAMMKLAERYAHKSPDQWARLFHRILYNGIKDPQRRRQRRGTESTGDASEWLDEAVDSGADEPLDYLAMDRTGQLLMRAIADLPLRQRQCLLLRSWEGYSVQDTARVMGCTPGSVKTHYARALAKLREQLED
jgi:RNA polymerase sigma-70 factor (ECF subfamily)